jgi:alkylhydroperoxidase family enzyme
LPTALIRLRDASAQSIRTVLDQFFDRADDALFERIRTHFNDDAIVELTGLIAFQNMSSKFNSALDLPAQGLCKLPEKGD